MNEFSRNKSIFSGCGFIGAFVFNAQNRENILKQIYFNKMLNSIHHRGPEGFGVWEKENIKLGHRRLSILDLSDRGKQPMTREHLTIVSNGEVYNFAEIKNILVKDGIRFTSETDTEVILRAYQKWGIEALHKFNGMFAFAIWDDKKKTLLLARDRIGIKPYYYFNDNKILIFGSEIQALMHSGYIPAEINWEAVYNQIFLSSFFEYNLTRTLVKNVFSLPPGHYMTVNPAGQTKLERYWDLPEAKFKHNKSQQELAEELVELLQNSIKYRLVSDVEVAAFLSGGMDSSIINVLAAKELKDYKLTSITVSYEGGGKDPFSDSEDKDLEYSRVIAKILKNKANHKIINIKPSEVTLELIDDIIDLASFSDDDRLLTILENYKTVKEQNFKVVLNGQGADEIMGGYIALKRFFVDGILDVQKPDIDLIKNLFSSRLIPDKSTLNKQIFKYEKGIYDNIYCYYHQLSGDLLEKSHRFLTKTLLQRILKFEDILSMKSSVECRLPFLDHRIIEWSFNIPFQKHIRVEDRMGKILLRKAAKDFLPKNLINRPKQAFPRADNQIAKNVLLKIYQENYHKIINTEIIQRIYKKEFLKINDFQISYPELWLLLVIWRWETKLNKFNA
ncbi:MAG: asparagine synthase (glutamine-hydrolyzing) [Bacteroidales bacterium]|nr:asparagine synthase (glutamine-hydrolyzing) [Bacteroidales bacterium]